ncbi:hypothetical protein [Alkalicoccus daliensis]|uniref:hypothetical protein n=1 Tax=Alkalicoccus daliensis TaxID=745820 RepID=UPI001AECF1EC|nr:hypothetical protein [Alkalicoccus daliensis]
MKIEGSSRTADELVKQVGSPAYFQGIAEGFLHGKRSSRIQVAWSRSTSGIDPGIQGSRGPSGCGSMEAVLGERN